MRVINHDEFHFSKHKIVTDIMSGAVFVHPTDTIYGLGCDATNNSAVKRIREIKHRNAKPFSVIAPSKNWILENCVVDKRVENWLGKLPGPYTLILKLKNQKAVSQETNGGMQTLGVRIPKHWISEVAEQLNFPIVTTSANIIGNNFMTSLEDLEPEIHSKVDFILYEGEKNGKPSTIIDLTSEEKIIERTS